MTDINFFEGSLLTSYVVPIITTKLQCNQNIPPQIQTIDKKSLILSSMQHILKKLMDWTRAFEIYDVFMRRFVLFLCVNEVNWYTTKCPLALLSSQNKISLYL